MRYGFIGGYGRSGTTVVMLALARSKEVFPLMETLLFTEAVFPFLDGRKDRKQFEAAYSRLVTVPKDMEFGGVKSKKNPPKVLQHFSANLRFAGDVLSTGKMDEEKVQEFTDKLFGQQAKDAGKSFCLEKSPRIITVAGRVARALHRSNFIHIHRDPRDVFCSVRSKNWGPNDLKTFVESYNKVMAKALRERIMVPVEGRLGRYMTVQMEDFVQVPELFLRAMVEFLGLKDDFVTEAASLVSDEYAHIGRWREELDMQKADAVMDGCRDMYENWRKLNFKP